MRKSILLESLSVSISIVVFYKLKAKLEESVNISIIFLILIYVFNIISTISIIFIKRDDTRSTFAWLLVFLFLPYIGFAFYFFFGSAYRMRIMSKKYGVSAIEESYSKNIDSHIDDIKEKRIHFNEIETENYRGMILLNANNAKSYYTQDNNAELLVDADENFKRLFEDIRNAKESIEMLYFIFKSKDDIGKKLIDILTEKAEKGVKVTFIYDGIGCLKTRIHDFDKLKKAGGEIYRFLPTMFRSFIYINYRLHRKIVIIDKKIAYTGGINVGDEYFGLKKQDKRWRDTSIRLTGSCVSAFQVCFWADLVFLKNQSRKSKISESSIDEQSLINDLKKTKGSGNAGVQIVTCGPGFEHETIKDGYVKMINAAKKYVYIQSPYFVPDSVLIDSLRLAAESGTDVRIMLPGVPDKKYVYYITLSFVEELLNSNIKVYLYEGFIHAKTIVIDDHVSTVGTTNLDIRSFQLDYEDNAFIYNTAFALKCRDVFLNDVKASKIIDRDEFANRSLWHRLCESICRFISPLA